MAERKKRGLGRGLGALIPDANSTDRPVDVFFSGSSAEEANGEPEKEKTSRAARNDPAASMQSSRRRKTKAASSNKSTDVAEDKPASRGSSSAAKTTGSTANGSKTAGAKNAGSGSKAAKSGTQKTSTPAASTKKSSSGKSAASGKSAPSAKPAANGKSATNEKTATGGKSSAGEKPAASAKNTETKTAKKKTAATSATGAKTSDSTTTETNPAENSRSTATQSKSGEVADSTSSGKSTSSTSRTASSAGSAEPTTANEGVGSVGVEPQGSAGLPAAVVTDDVDQTEKTADSATSEYPDQREDVRETHPGVYTSSAERGQAAAEGRAGAAQKTDTTDVVTRVADPAGEDAGDQDSTGVDSEAVTASEETSAEGLRTASPSSEDSTDDDSDASSADDSSSASSAEAGPDVDSFEGVESIPDTEFGEIPVDLIDANPRQPRTVFDEDLLAELVHSIREIGVLQPVVVRQKPSDRARFELIMGERRLRAAKDAGLSTIPAIIRYVEDTDLLRDALLENLHRAELNPLEEAAAYGQLLEDFGCTQEELSERIGRSRPQISNTLRLLRLPPLVQRRVAAGVISAGHARAILGLRDPEHMEVLAQRIVAEGLSVRASEEAVVLLNRGDTVNVSRATTKVSPEFLAVAERLGDRLDTKVNISVGKRKGKLSVEFANQEDLDRILGLLGIEDHDGV